MFNEVLDIFFSIVISINFYYVECGNNLEFWQTIFEFRRPKQVFLFWVSSGHGRAVLSLFLFFRINTRLFRFSFQGKITYSPMDIHVQHLASATLPNLRG